LDEPWAIEFLHGTPPTGAQLQAFSPKLKVQPPRAHQIGATQQDQDEGGFGAKMVPAVGTAQRLP